MELKAIAIFRLCLQRKSVCGFGLDTLKFCSISILRTSLGSKERQGKGKYPVTFSHLLSETSCVETNYNNCNTVVYTKCTKREGEAIIAKTVSLPILS